MLATCLGDSAVRVLGGETTPVRTSALYALFVKRSGDLTGSSSAVPAPLGGEAISKCCVGPALGTLAKANGGAAGELARAAARVADLLALALDICARALRLAASASRSIVSLLLLLAVLVVLLPPPPA